MEQPKCPVIGEWISKMSYSHTKEHDLAIKTEVLVRVQYSTDGAHRHQAKRKPDTKDRTLRDSLCYMKCPEQVNPSDRQEWCLPGTGDGA